MDPWCTLDDDPHPWDGAPALVILRPAWMDAGACLAADRDLFFPEKPDAQMMLRAARGVCDRCPVRRPCLAYALADPDVVGVWGGTTDAERKALRRAEVA